MVGLEKQGWYEAELNHLGGSVDAKSGAIPFAATIANRNGILRPGMHARIRVTNETQEMSSVLPTSALFSHDGHDYLVEEVDDEKCILRKVKIGRRNEELVELIDPLPAGSKYVTRGTFSIASEALLESEE